MAATLHTSRFPLSCLQIATRLFTSPSNPSYFKKPRPRPRFGGVNSKSRVSRSVSRLRSGDVIDSRSSSDGGNTSVVESDRPPFDLNLAVVLAGFAFEAYSSPPVRSDQFFFLYSFCDKFYLLYKLFS